MRPEVNGKRTWRKLKATTERFALKEGREKLAAQERSKHGSGRDPFSRGNTFAEMAQLYLAARCPNRKLEPRAKAFCDSEKTRIATLTKFFGQKELHAIKLVLLPDYKKWRVRLIKKKKYGGERTVEMDLCTLSNVLNYAVATGHLDFNYVRSARPRFRTEENIQHCREFAPESADELHRIASAFFSGRPRSEVMGWITLFTAMSGCRISELLRLRMDAKPGEPGFIDGNFLFIRRSKRGVNPFILITDEFSIMLSAFKEWHKIRFGEAHPYFFPGRTKGMSVQKDGFSHAIPRIARDLGLPQRRAHGLRSFYVTKRRSDGAQDTQIASEIGDKTTSLISKTYGSVPPNWVRGEPLKFVPKKVEPAWSKWKP